MVLEATDMQQPEPPVVEDWAPTRGAGANQAAPEQEGIDPIVPEVEVAPHG